MFESLLQAVRGEASGERALADLHEITRFHRVQASPGLSAAADWLAGRLAAAGLTPEIDHVAGDGHTRCLGHLMPQGWACERAIARLHDGAQVTPLCDAADVPLSVVLRSVSAHGRFPLVLVKGGEEERDYEGIDVRGRVILSDGAVHRVHRLGVVARGAAGLLSFTRRLAPPVRLADDELDAINYTSFWWGEDEPRGWGFVVTPRVGRELCARLATGAALDLDVDLAARAFDTPIPLVSALLPGTDASAAEVLVVSHLCHPQPSANDNASGVAANLETARVLAALRGSGVFPAGPRGVRFLWMPEFTGTFAWLERRLVRRGAPGLLAALNLDMVGEDQEKCGSTLLIEHPPHFMASFAEPLLARIRHEAQDWVESFSGPGHFSMMRMAEVPYSGGSDHMVLIDPAFGVPCPMLIQWPDRFYHSSHDTPDKSSPASLALAVRCAATYAGFLANAGEVEVEWLRGEVAREARRHVLGARTPEHQAAEQTRGLAALASLERFSPGVAPTPASSAAERDFREFVAREATPAAGVASSKDARRPRRRLAAPLHYQRWMLPGFDALPAEVREAWRAVESARELSGPEFDLAWYACDGKRTVAEIAGLVRAETGRDPGAAIGSLFEWTARLELSDWDGKA